ncbi:hypothetical protein LTT66_12780 [Nocardia gipuzkoensis]|uniref:hypothetical protein n=1 Tax=Nocardia TaxID=1817 RepID=UPI001E5DAD44|nr:MULTISPECIES: hypothetical protein [Nocardia]UGT70953.1 hypothetical protein LTT66_12780 [Nocardia gipuzkoensis]
MAALDDEHLAAVMAHERAHLTGRHHVLLALTRALAGVFPRIDLFVTGAAQVARLVEMAADDIAAELHGRQRVREALLALADTGAASPFEATEVGLVDRIRRLSPLPTPTPPQAGGFASSLAIGVVLAGPLAATLAAAGGIGVCTLGG